MGGLSAHGNAGNGPVNGLGSIISFIGAVLAGCFCGQSHADGGLVRLDRDLGSYRVVALTAPTPLVEGDLDLTVMVRNASDDRILDDVRIEVAIIPSTVDSPSSDTWIALDAGRVSHQGGAGSIFEVWEGSWNVHLRIHGPLGLEHGEFDLPVGARSRFADNWPWLLLVPGLLGLWFLREWAKMNPDRSGSSQGFSS